MSFLSQLVPGFGIAKGMTLTLKRFFAPKATIKYPEQKADVSTRFRGRLQLLWDENGLLKCETCFQCAQACPIECIDMGGLDTKGRFHVHWGPPETYGERREESALRRSGRVVPDAAYDHFAGADLGAVDEILARHDHDPARMLAIFEEVQAAYGHLPVAALKRISETTGAWYAMLYGTASYYRHLRFESPEAERQAAAMAGRRPSEDAYLAALGASLAGGADQAPRPTTKAAAKGSAMTSARSTKRRADA